MRILQVCHDYKGPFVSICQQYAAGFAAHEVTTLFLKGEALSKVSEDVGGDHVVYLESSKRSLRGLKIGPIRKLIKLIKFAETEGRGFDLVVAHRYKAIYLVGIASYFHKLPLMLGVVHEHQVFKRITRRLFVTFWRPMYFIAGVSASVSEDIDHDCKGLKESGRLLTLSNAIDVSKQDQMLNREQSLRAMNLASISKTCKTIGTIGRLVYKKQHELLIEAVAKLDDPDIRLIIIGDGPRRGELEALVARLGVERQVSFAGHQPDAFRLVRGFDLFVFTSGHEEAFGIVLLEAMLAKVAVLSSDAPGPAAVVAGLLPTFASGNSLDLKQKIEAFFVKPETEIAALKEAAYDRVIGEYSYKGFRQNLEAQLKGLKTSS